MILGLPSLSLHEDDLSAMPLLIDPLVLVLIASSHAHGSTTVVDPLLLLDLLRLDVPMPGPDANCKEKY